MSPAEPHRLNTIAECAENPSHLTPTQPSTGNRDLALPADLVWLNPHSTPPRPAPDVTERSTWPFSVPKHTRVLPSSSRENTGNRDALYAFY